MFESLDRAYDARDVHLVFAPVDPKWDAYRGERRFREVISLCGFTRHPRAKARQPTTFFVAPPLRGLSLRMTLPRWQPSP
jgi:hypothetical protein